MMRFGENMELYNEYELISHSKLADCSMFIVDMVYRPMHLHKEMELCYILSGTCRVSTDRQSFTAGAGGVLLFDAGAGHEIWAVGAPARILTLQLSHGFCSRFYPQIRNVRFGCRLLSDCLSEDALHTLQHAMLQALKDNPRLDTVVLCLDHDPAGIEACGRLAEILVRNGYGAVKRLQSACKDWNEDLKGRYGEETIPAQEHPRVMECRAWTEVLKEVTESINIKYANRSYICRYYQDIYNELKKGRGREQLMDAFDGPGMLLTGVLVRCMEKEGIALGRETSADQILENLSKRYQPHKDKGNFNTRIRQMQAAFEETLEVFDTKDLEQKEDQELLARKCMSLAMECIRAHIFVAIDCGEEQMKPAKQTVKEQKMEHQEGGMMLCSQS